MADDSDGGLPVTHLGITHLEKVLFSLTTHHFSASRWRPLGLALGLIDSTLNDIEANYRRVDEKLMECLSAWLRRVDSGSHDDEMVIEKPSMKALVFALKKIKEYGVAEKIEEEIIHEEARQEVLLLPPNDREKVLPLLTNEEENKEDSRKYYSDFFNCYNDRFISVLSQDDTSCSLFVARLRSEQLISSAEKETVERLTDNLVIKTKMLLRFINLLLSNAKKPEMTLKKVLLIFKDHDQGLFEEITHAMSEDLKFHSELEAKLISTIRQPLEAADHSPVSSPFCFPLVKHFKFFRDPINSYSERLRSIYRHHKVPDAVNELPMTFIEPVMIEVDPSQGDLLNESIENMKRNRTVVSMDYIGSIPRGSRYLLEGSTGIGKTRLAFELRDRWVNKSAFSDYSLFLFLQLRDLQDELADSGLTVRDLIGHYMSSESWNEAVLQTIIDEGGQGVCIFLEGYNELKKELQSKSIFFEIIIGKVLPCATVIVTSQPIKSSPIKRNTANLSVISVIGFDEYAINQFSSLSLSVAQQREFNNLPHKIKSCLFIPIILRIVTYLLQEKNKSTRGDPLPFSNTTQLYKSLVDNIIYSRFKLDADNDKSKDSIEQHKLRLGRLAWKGIYKDSKCSFKRRHDFETLGLMQKEHGRLRDVNLARFRFLHVTIQEYLAAHFVVEKFSSRVKEVFSSCSDYPRYSGTLVFLAGLMSSQDPDVLPSIPPTLYNFTLLHQVYEAQSSHLATCNNKVKLTSAFPFFHDMLALGYCINKSTVHWSLGFTLRSISKEHIEMLAMGLGREPRGKIEELNLSLNELGCEGVSALLRIPDCVFKSLTILNLRGNGLNGNKVSSDVACKFLVLPSLKKFSFHHNLFDDRERDQQLPIVEAICRSKSLIFVSLSNLTPNECQVLLSHDHKTLKVIDLYQLCSDSLLACITSLTKSSVNTLNLHDSQITPQHSRLFPEKLRREVSSIKRLELINCGINDESIVHIADTISVSKIDNLSLNDNLITEGGSILRMITSKRLKRLKLQRNRFGKDVVCMFAASADTKHLKLHLSVKWKDSIDVMGIIFD